MRILGIETSCDETSAAIIEADPTDKQVKLISSVTASSLILHAKTGGIIPEIAAREQIKYILPVIGEALIKAGLQCSIFNSQFSIPVDAIAVTYGPGLIGSLLVGVETAKTLAYCWNKPLIPVNHLLGHLYANFISTKPKLDAKIEFPALGLIVSGGHTDLVLIKKHGQIKWLGGTRDDAAGEALDKIGRLLNLNYPAGPEIEARATQGKAGVFHLPRPLLYDQTFDFSFSGLKTAALRTVEKQQKLTKQQVNDLCLEIQNAITEILIKKTLRAAEKYQVKSILLGGGVSANQSLRNEFKLKIENLKLKIRFFVPAKNLCTDNAAMIAAAAFYLTKDRSALSENHPEIGWQKLTAKPNLYFN